MLAQDLALPRVPGGPPVPSIIYELINWCELPGDTTPVILRNISFSNIRGTVTTDPPQLSEAKVTSTANQGERHSCITFNCVGDSIMENISLDNINPRGLRWRRGGAEDAARRDLPQVAGDRCAGLGSLACFTVLYASATSAGSAPAEHPLPGVATPGSPSSPHLRPQIQAIAAIHGIRAFKPVRISPNRLCGAFAR